MAGIFQYIDQGDLAHRQDHSQAKRKGDRGRRRRECGRQTQKEADSTTKDNKGILMTST